MMRDAREWHASTHTDWALMMQAAQGGDTVTYRRLLRDLVPFLRAMAVKVTGRPDMADDVVQETLIAVHRVRASYDPARPFQPWVVSILRRRAIDLLRAQGRRGQTADLIDAANIADPHSTNAVDQIEARQTLAQALSALTPGQRQAIELMKLRELSLKEAAHESGLSIPALKVATHRAVKALSAAWGHRAL